MGRAPLIVAGLGIAVLAGAAAPALAAETWTYWIEPCSPDLARDSGCHPTDRELGVWALKAWERATNGALVVQPASSLEAARLRVFWVKGTSQLYGETRPIMAGRERGAEVYVLPLVAAGSDPLLREAIVYLTCLHETGHAFGLPHTREFADIMYSFQYGGDIPEYFARYRRTLKARADIQRSSGISPSDQAALAAALNR